MHKLTVATVAVAFLLVTACGRVAERQFASNMSQEEALGVIDEVLVSNPEGLSESSDEVATAKGLSEIIQELVESGEVKLSGNARSAVSSTGNLDMTQLNELLALLSKGGSLADVAKGMVANADGSSTKAKFNLDTVLAILQAVAPIIATVAPQFSPIISAIIVIVPMIKVFVGLFKKPTAWLALPYPAYT